MAHALAHRGVVERARRLANVEARRGVRGEGICCWRAYISTVLVRSQSASRGRHAKAVCPYASLAWLVVYIPSLSRSVIGRRLQWSGCDATTPWVQETGEMEAGKV